MMTLRDQKGFSMIEALLYMVLTGFMLLAIATTFRYLVNAQAKYTAYASVTEEGEGALGRILQELRNAQSISTPTSGSSGATLSFIKSGVTETVSLSGNALYLTVAPGSPVALTSSRVAVSAFSVSNLTAGTSPGTARVTFTLSATNPSGMTVFQASQTFYGSATLRP